MHAERRRIVLPGQYGPAFDDGGPALVVESREFFTARPVHRAKAHLWLSALRHRVRELGDRAEHVQVDTLREALDGRAGLDVVDPPSSTLRAQVRHWGQDVLVLPSRGFVTDEAEFAEWAAQGTGRFRMEQHYERVRRREGWLMEQGAPLGGAFSLDAQNRQPPPKGATTLGLPEPWWPVEDDIDEQVRHDLDRWERDGVARFVGRDDRRRFAVTADEARRALDDFVAVRLGDFGPFEDATLTDDWTMAHSLLSVPMNLGVLDPSRRSTPRSRHTGPRRHRWPASRVSSGRSPGGATTSGTSTGGSATTTVPPRTRSGPTSSCPTGGGSWTPARSTPSACGPRSRACTTTGGCTTSSA